MALKDRGKVDLNAVYSQKSINAFNSFFSLENSFIAHHTDDKNDYGIDCQVQIIKNYEATGFVFPVQIKSSKSFKERNNCKILQFKTNRLQVLIEGSCGSGMIILYDVKEETLYFDYALEIIKRLRIENEKPWEEQKTVTIKISKENILDDKTIKAIHSRQLKLWTNQSLLFAKDGYKNIDKLFRMESSNADSLSIIENTGLDLFKKGEINILKYHLENLEKKDLKKPRVSFVAAITYVELGEIIEANYFFHYAEKDKTTLSDEEKDIYNLQYYKCKFFEGKYSLKELKGVLESFRSEASLSSIKDIIEINLLSIKVIEAVGSPVFSDDLLVEINDQIDKVLSKNLLIADYIKLLYLTEILSTLYTRKLMEALVDAKIGEETGIKLPFDLRSKLNKELTNTNGRIIKLIEFIANRDTVRDNSYAIILLKFFRAKHYFGTCYSYFNARINWDNKKGAEEIINHAINDLISCYNYFIGNSHAPMAYRSIVYINELYILAENWLKKAPVSTIDKNKINVILEQFQEQDFHTENLSMVRNSLDMQRKLFEEKISPFELMEESDIQNIALGQLKRLNLPEDRLVNVENEIRDLYLFHKTFKGEYTIYSDQYDLTPTSFVKQSHFTVTEKGKSTVIIEGHDINEIISFLKIRKG
ncbi:hypothetical protein GCM10027429_02840 [Marivirga atlantica]|uniref:DUF4365 domain-containing protein n=1 Tax=Marivirga atlantica TaxID=1548457 RepID=A0A937DI85_9BACT|nr:DUF4365 domain-containing protein [Marivirga atlantica]MBL0763896.1 DUF4365 domain-containing protein [Marivirga atlantica]